MVNRTPGVNPWLSIWTKPRETISQIVKFNPKYRFLILSFLYGLPMLFHTAQSQNLGEMYTAVGIVIVAIVLATFVGMLGISIASLLINWTGKWIGGKANYHQVRAAVSWSNVPNIITVLVWFALIWVFKNEAFMGDLEEQSLMGWEQMLVTGAIVVQAIVSIWSFIILVKALGQVQGFSAWKGVLNVLIPFFLVGIAVWLITWAVWVATVVLGIS